MIINSLDNSKKIKSQEPSRSQMKLPNLIITPKEVNLNDFLFHYPVFRSNVNFGSKSDNQENSNGVDSNGVENGSLKYVRLISKAKDFNTSIPEYFGITAENKIVPDKKQIDAALSLYNGDDTIVTAPTGTGKTLIAEYVIRKNLAEGKNTVYTTPLKALSNEKFRDFCKKFGEENVGLQTGDIKINTQAPIQVMTTEIYRNRLMGESAEALAEKNKNLATVIYDEFHTMNDPHRGEVWETSIMYTPPHVQQLALSATVGNDTVVEKWFNRILTEKKQELGLDSLREARLVHVSPKERHVPLKFFVYDSGNMSSLMTEKYNLGKIKQALISGAQEPLFELQKEVLKEISKKAGKEETVENGVNVLSSILTYKEGAKEVELMENDLVKKLNFDKMEAKRIAALLSDKSERKLNGGLKHYSQAYKNKIEKNKIALALQNGIVTQSPEIKLAKTLAQQDKIPAIFFKFSKSGCDSLREEFLKTGESLLNEEEQKQVKEIVKKHIDKGAYLGVDENVDSFLSGTAVHHAGKMPDYKRIVEELAQKKLCKIIFATDTLGAGINVPAKTVVMTELSKYSGKDIMGKEQYRDLTANEFHQMAGRAGRRGKDLIGNVIIMTDKEHTTKDIYKIVTASADNLKSNFKPTYSFISHFIIQNKTVSKIEKAVDRSFLRESLESEEFDSKLILDKVKTEFKQMSKIIKKPEMGFFKEEKEGLVPTIKGAIVAKTRGVDELLFASLMTETHLEKLSPDQLAAVACSLTVGHEKNQSLPTVIDNETNEVLGQITSIKDKIKTEELNEGIDRIETAPNRYEAQFVQKWVQKSEVNPVASWQDIVENDIGEVKHFDEGDFFKSVNRTADIVQQMGEVADEIIKNPTKHDGAKDLVKKMEIISKNAKIALESLKKPPVLEILKNESVNDNLKLIKQIR